MSFGGVMAKALPLESEITGSNLAFAYVRWRNVDSFLSLGQGYV